ncbi:MAG: hypothetical protein KatS3mg058_1540 [Roseiflexus sp.]|nr:MAG: hypothetical protein KatS3mg058_1540 [Roseiflexus sp.]
MHLAGMHSVGIRRFALTPCPAPARGGGETGAARGRPPLGVSGCAVIARPAQPVEALSSLRHRHSRSKHSHHCATGAAGRSTLITAPPAQPVEALSSLRHRRSQSKHSHHCATGAASRSTLITAPPAQPVAARGHCETGAASRSTLITAPPAPRTGPSPAGRAGVRTGVRSTRNPPRAGGQGKALQSESALACGTLHVQGAGGLRHARVRPPLGVSGCVREVGSP